MLITLMAAAGGAGAASPSLFETPLIPMVFIFVIFYFLMIRPQQKLRKQHQEMITNVRRGDTVVTAGGIVAKVTKVQEDGEEVTVQLADGVQVQVVKSTLSDVRSKTEPKKEKSDKK